MHLIELGFLLCIAGIVGYTFYPVSRRYDLYAFVKKPLLTSNEQEFYSRLLRALPGHIVLTQVSMGALVDVDPKVSEKFRVRLRELFNRKIVDFVICGRGMRVVALVELDDRTHRPEKDKLRDTLTFRAGYPTLRYESKNKPSVEQIAADVLKLASTEEALDEQPLQKG